MPLGHNRRHPEFGKVMPGAHPPGSQGDNVGLGSAILLSLGLHALIALWVWHGFAGIANKHSGATRIIDTRVHDPGIEVEVCLRLLDPSKPVLKERSSQPAASRENGIDSSKPSGLAGTESWKLQNQDSAVSAPSKSQPQPMSTKVPIATSQGEGSIGGSSTRSRDGGVGHDGASFFHIAAQAKSVVYVIDRSVSMGPSGGLIRAKRELLASLRGMPAQTRFQIIIFNRSFETISAGSAGLLPATNENKRKAAEFLVSVQPEGGTLPVPALKRALMLKPEVVFFLSDGGDWTDRQVQEIVSVNRGHSVIHVVDFGGPVHDQLHGPMRLLASKNQGEYRAIRTGGNEPWQMRSN
jgi:hypothetical protein